MELFADLNLSGNSTVIKTDHNIPNTSEIGWNDRSTSLYATVTEGKKLSVYKDPNYTGDKLEFGAGSHIIHDLRIHDFNDVISSLKWESA